MVSRINMRGHSWLLLVMTVIATLNGLQLINSTQENAARAGVVAVLILMWVCVVVQWTSPPLKNILAWPLKRYRRAPIFYWLLLLIYTVVGVLLWILIYQPAAGRIDASARFYMLVWGWLLVFALGYGMDHAQWKLIMTKLAASRATGAMISLTVIVVMVFGAEIALRLFFVRSDSGSMTLSSKHWFDVYWQPINALGYRDYEIATGLDESVRRVLVVGDSFAAGHGTPHIEDTFPHILERTLGDDATVNVIANPGWDTVIELEALENYPLKPDTVILSYVLNDIEPAAFQHGMRRPATLPVSGLVDFWVNRSYIASYAWFIANGNWVRNYSGNMLSSFDDEAIWQDHQAQLAQLIDWGRMQDAQLVVLVWPFLDAPDVSEKPARQVEQFFVQQGIPVVNMLDVIEGENTSQLVVSAMDRHPNRYTHTLAAQALYDLLAGQD